MPFPGDALPVKIALIAGGGAIGCTLRYGTSHYCGRLFGDGFPWGTLAVNLFGCLIIGLLYEMSCRSVYFGPGAKLFFITGFLGGLTTFSTYALENANALSEGSWMLTCLNIVGSNALGVALVFIGMRMARTLVA